MDTLHINPSEIPTTQVRGLKVNATPLENYMPLSEKKKDGIITAHAAQTISAAPKSYIVCGEKFADSPVAGTRHLSSLCQ